MVHDGTVYKIYLFCKNMREIWTHTYTHNGWQYFRNKTNRMTKMLKMNRKPCLNFLNAATSHVYVHNSV